MLLAVEGGGFFSSSASGYSMGLTLLVLGLKNKEKPMRVAPWNQYQLVDQETEPEIQLASGKNGLLRGCASALCFGCTATGNESPSSLKAGPTQTREVLPEPLKFCENNDQAHRVVSVVDNDNNSKVVSLKSSLKKLEKSAGATGTEFDGGSGNTNKHEASCDRDNGSTTCKRDKRKVQWTDTTGGQLFEIREFEMSEDGSDEFDYENGRACSCRIM